MEKTNYIMGGVGYIALLAAIVEQARADAKRGDKDAELGIAEWADVVAEDVNFKLYEQPQPQQERGQKPSFLFAQQFKNIIIFLKSEYSIIKIL